MMGAFVSWALDATYKIMYPTLSQNNRTQGHGLKFVFKAFRAAVCEWLAREQQFLNFGFLPPGVKIRHVSWGAHGEFWRALI